MIYNGKFAAPPTASSRFFAAVVVHIFRSLAWLASLLLVANGVWAWLVIDDFLATTNLLRQLQSLRTEIKILKASASVPTTEDSMAEWQAREGEETVLVKQLELSLRWSSVNFLFLVATTLMATLVCSITITYFIGTSRWCKEVVEAYALDPQLAAESIVCKRRAFPWALAGIVVVLLLVTLGGAANPGVRLTDATPWGVWYKIAAALGTAAVVFCFWKQSQHLAKNYAVIQTILDEVRRAREPTMNDKTPNNG